MDNGSDVALIAPQQASAEFTGKRGPLFGLLLKNALLTFLTLGIYRFWAKTAERRYFWSNIKIAGEPLEYTGLAKELLIGFLIALAVLVPLSIGVQLAQDAFLISNPELIVFISLGYAFLMFCLIQFAVYRMWRYRLTRTTWRGVRFRLDGSAVKYAGISILWTVITIATIGIAYPWRRAALIKYETETGKFGNIPLGFHGSGGGLFVGWMKSIGISLILGVTLGIAGMLLAGNLLSLISGAGIWSLLPPILFISLMLAMLFYRIFEIRYRLNHTRIGDVTLTSKLKPTGVLIGMIFMVVLMVVSLGGLIGGMIGLVATGEANPDAFEPLLILGLSALVIVLNTGMKIVGTLVVTFTLIKNTCDTLTFEGLESLSAAIQSGQIPSRGEGLADALDVDGAFDLGAI